MTLTAQALARADGSTVLRDTVVPGLHSRGQRFFLYFRTRAGRERRPKLGEYPVMSLAQARAVAKDMLVQVAAGRDPIAERRVERSAPTVDQALQQFDIEHVATLKPTTAKEVRRLFEKHVPGTLRREKVSSIEYADIHRLHQSLKATPYVANRLLSHLSTFFNRCEAPWKYREHGTNPCRGVKRYKERKIKRYMSAEEAVGIAQRLDAEAWNNRASVAFIYLLIFTGARKGEIAAARWSEIRGNVIHRADAKNGARPIFLPPAAMAILEQLPHTSGTLTGIKDPKKLWDKVRRAAGCPDLRIHDLRHSFASVALSSGLTLDQVGELLGHSSTQTTKRYAHLIDATAQAAAAKTATEVMARMGRHEQVAESGS